MHTITPPVLGKLYLCLLLAVFAPVARSFWFVHFWAVTIPSEERERGVQLQRGGILGRGKGGAPLAPMLVPLLVLLASGNLTVNPFKGSYGNKHA